MAEKLEVGVVMKGTDKISEDLTKVNKKTTDISGSVDMASGSLDKMSGGMVTMFKGMLGGIKKAVMGMKTLRGAIMSTGIGLLVVAVAALASAFTSSEEGQNKFAKIMAVIGSLTDNVIDLFADLGEGIISAFENPQEAVKALWTFVQDNFVNRLVGLVEFLPAVGKAMSQAFDLEFAAAAKTAMDAVAKITLGVEDFTDKVADAGEAGQEWLDQAAKEADLAAKVADMRAKAALLDRELLVDRSTMEAKIAALKLKSRQEEEFTAAERKEALVEAQALEEKLLEKEMESLQLISDAQELENTFARSNTENLNKAAEAQAALNNIQTRRLTSQKATQRELNRLNKEIEADENLILKTAEANAAALKKAIQTDAQNEIDVVTAKYLKLNELAVGNAEAEKILKDKQEAELLAITEKYAVAEEEVDTTASDKKIATEKATAQAVKQARLGIVAAGFDSLKSMAKTEEGQKRLAISQILVNQGIAMSAAIRAALAASASLPQPAGMFAAPGFVAGMLGMALSSFAQIKGIMNKAGGAGASIGSGGASGAGGVSSGMQLGLTPNLEDVYQPNGDMPPVKAYVVQSQLADESALVSQLKAMASL